MSLHTCLIYLIINYLPFYQPFYLIFISWNPQLRQVTLFYCNYVSKSLFFTDTYLFIAAQAKAQHQHNHFSASKPAGKSTVSHLPVVHQTQISRKALKGSSSVQSNKNQVSGYDNNHSVGLQCYNIPATVVANNGNILCYHYKTLTVITDMLQL